MKHATVGGTRRPARSWIVVVATAATAISGCAGGGSARSGSASPGTAAAEGGGSAAARARGPITSAERKEVLEAREQRAAQRSWCEYLQALYVRAFAGAAGDWPRFEQCLAATTTASPAMLERTAECSMAALQRFQGDPFSEEYAAEVSRCGAEAIAAMSVADDEMAPFVAAICERMTSCGNATFEECRDRLAHGAGPHLERAIGAINARGRTELRACLKGASCEELGEHITACLQPLMDGLLWLPDQ